MIEEFVISESEQDFMNEVKEHLKIINTIQDDPSSNMSLEQTKGNRFQ